MSLPVYELTTLEIKGFSNAAGYEALQRELPGAGGELLAGLTLFDLYRGEQIGAGKKSLAFGLTYQATDRTLTDAEVAKVRERIANRLREEMGAGLRG